ncbi:hypothetical protein [Streptococcus oralis]|uniref:hypothetical protein n=1 Tax=Streptococcus oralis TaxID=1303 RepID=UPI0001CC59B3|nr:hypothetical protein [Streptococcus oralis]EFE56702.1 hypothetical protein HMPREF8579_0662 [Streptococcus oralis ATCC 35037]EFO02447.1 hypothetical protein SMSK23_0898 [Streptococcus oralis ATCC 35037]KZX03343.1 hypothetical protein A4222_06675 [Streptococcus oralis]OOR78761.1 hypothetical protein B0176_03150 [Streptococcus oralis]QQB72475.1 hypothetical protein I6H77_02590 [Streptococcus oralis]
MAFYKKLNGYSVSLAKEALSNELVKLVGKQLEIQYEFEKTGEVTNGKEKMKRTDNIQAYQVYVATDNHNPFKVKFLPENKPDLSKIDIGDIVEFETLEAFENQYGQLYFRATGIQKKGK